MSKNRTFANVLSLNTGNNHGDNINYIRCESAVENAIGLLKASDLNTAEKDKLISFLSNKRKTEIHVTKRKSVLHDIVSLLSRDEEEQDLNRELITCLIDSGLKIQETDSSLLIQSFKEGKIGVFEALFLHCDINAVDDDKRTLLIIAVCGSNIELVKRILNRGVSDVNFDKTDKFNYTALCYAAHLNLCDICKILLDNGADPNSISISPLYLAIRNDSSLEIIKSLIAKGADVNRKIDFTGFDILTAAAYRGANEVVKLLVENGAIFSGQWYKNLPLVAALEKDDFCLFKIFVDRDVNIFCDNYKGSNILHEAASHGSCEISSYLIENTNIDLDIKDRYGKTAFYLSCQNGRLKCMKILYENGANCTLCECKYLSPLNSAILHNHPHCVQFILKNNIYPVQELRERYMWCQESDNLMQDPVIDTFKKYLDHFPLGVDSLV